MKEHSKRLLSILLALVLVLSLFSGTALATGGDISTDMHADTTTDENNTDVGTEESTEPTEDPSADESAGDTQDGDNIPVPENDVPEDDLTPASEEPADESAELLTEGDTYTVTLYTTVTGLTVKDSNGSDMTLTEGSSGAYHSYTFTGEADTYTYTAEGRGTGNIKVAKNEEIYLRAVRYKLHETAPDKFKVRVVNTEDEDLVYTSTEDNEAVYLLIPAYDYSVRYQFYFEPLNDRYVSFHGNLWVPKGTTEFDGFKQESYNLSDGGKYIMSPKAKVTFKIPAGSSLKVQELVKFYRQLNEYDVTIVNAEDGYDYYEAYVPNSVAGCMQYEVSKEGYMKHAANFSPSAGTVVVEKLEGKPSDTNTSFENGLLTNGNASKFIELDVGETFDMWYTRAWQAVSSITGNEYVDPDRHFYILEGDSVTVDQYGVVEAVKEGTTVVAMTYDALKYNDTVYGAVDPDKVAVFVFDVGGNNTGLDIGFNLSDLQSFYIAKTVTIDGVEEVATNDSYKYTFTPKTTGEDAIEVAVSTVYGYPTPTMSAWKNYTKSADGSFTIDLYPGRNIVRVKAGSAEQYYVLNAIASNVTIENVTNPDNAITAGDSVKVGFSGVITPQPKLGAIYNPGYGGTVYLEGTLSSDAEGAEDTTVQGDATQYGIATMSNIVVTPSQAGNTTLKDVRIHLGAFGSAPSSHWQLGLQSGGGSYNGGLAPESTAYYCFFQNVSFAVSESDIPEKAAAIVETINAIGEVELNAASKEKIDAARYAYDKASDQVKNSITAEQLAVLTNAEAAYQKLLDASITDSIKTKTIDGKEYYVITNADELLWFSRLVNGLVEGHELTVNQTKRESVNAILENDIVLNKELINTNYELNTRTTALNKWTPIGGRQWQNGWMMSTAYFRGTFDGNGHTISGMYLEKKTDFAYYGLVGNISGGTVKDLKVKDSYIAGIETGIANAAGVVGSGSGTIENVSFEGRVRGTGDVYGIAASNSKTLSNCHVKGVIETNGCMAGGLVGSNSGTITDCSFNGKLISNATVASYNTGMGGIAYSNSGTIKKCIVEGSIIAPYCASGGIVGGYAFSNTGTIDTCSALCDVTGSTAAGISASTGNPKINSCFYYGILNGTKIYGTAPAFIAADESTYWNTNTALEVANSVPVSAEQIENGNAAYIMGITWGQKIGTDKFPVFADGTNQIFCVGGKYFNASAAVLDALVADIGTVALDGADGCFAKTTEAMQCYNILSEEEKANAASVSELLAKQKAYDDVVTALIAKIEAIKPVDSSDECKARIDAAKADYDAYVSKSGDITLITNRGFIEEAYADYALWVRHDEEYAVEKTITKTTIDGKEFYEITNADQLMWFGKLVNGTLAKTERNNAANAVLKNDITINENLLATILDDDGNVVTEKLEGLTHWDPIGLGNGGFKGEFNGNGHTVKGILISVVDTKGYFWGLFGDVWGPVKNVNVSDSYISVGRSTAGPIAGRTATNGSLENASVTNTVVEAEMYVGGVIGSVQGRSIVKNTYSFATLQDTGTTVNAGGIAGDLNNGSVENCYFGGTSKVKNYGGIAAGMYNGSATNCYYLAEDGIDYINVGGAFSNSTITGGGAFTPEQMKSGWLAHKLGAAFGQKIGVDDYPVLDGTKRVFFVNDTYVNASAQTAIDLIDAIGTVALDGSENCFTNIVIAQECYDMLSDEEKADVTNAQTLRDAQTAYDAVAKSIIDEISTFTPLTTENYKVYDASTIVEMLENYTSRGGDLAKVTNYADYEAAVEERPSIPHQLVEATMTTTEIDGEEYYRITNLDQFMWYTCLLNGTLLTDTKQNTSANAILETDLVVNENLLETMNGNIVKPTGTVVLEKIERLNGTFDGNGHSISGVYNESGALFTSVNNGGVLKNLTIKDSFSGSATSLGCGIAQALYSNSSIENCHFEGKLVGAAGAGISYELDNSSIIKNCSVKADIISYATSTSAYSRWAGICGYVMGPVENCFYQGKIDLTNAVSGSRNYGGVVAKTFEDASVKNCYAACEIIGDAHTYTGLFSSENLGTYENNYYLADETYKAFGTSTTETIDGEGVTAMSAKQFADGTVLKLLGEPYVQRIGTDPYPEFDSNMPEVKIIVEFETDTYSEGDIVTAKVYASEHTGADNVGYSLAYDPDVMVLKNAEAAEGFSVARSDSDKQDGTLARSLYKAPNATAAAGEDGRILIDTLTFVMLADGAIDINFAIVEKDADFDENSVYAVEGGVYLNTKSEVNFITTLSADQKAAAEVDALIGVIGTPIYKYARELQEARAAYASLTDNQKAMVENYADLEAAAAKYDMWLMGDINLDGRVNAADLSLLLSYYGTEMEACDLNMDGTVTSADLSILLSNYGTML